MTPATSHFNRALWWSALRQPSVWRRALLPGLSVGFFQAIINQGDYWASHTVTSAIAAKTVISPLVTLSVALISAAGTFVDRQRQSNS